MKKLLYLLTFLLFFAGVNAASISTVENKISNTKKLSPKFRKIMNVVVYDKCGQRLSFTVSCNSCSWEELGAGADNVIFEHTNDKGCFFL